MKRFMYLAMWNIIMRSPWYRAYLLAATRKYQESPLYRYRMIEFDENFAKEMFTSNIKTELPMFKWQVRKDKMMMLRIILLPYSITLL